MNTDAVGARILVTTGKRTQRRDVKAGSSYLSQNDLRAHFGLGTAASADRLDVRWPSGQTETIYGVAVNQIVTIEEGKGDRSAQHLQRRIQFTIHKLQAWSLEPGA